MVALLLFLAGAGLLVTGVALWSIPAALVVAGALVLVLAVLVDLASKAADDPGTEPAP